MNLNKLQATTAALFTTAAIANGASAVGHNNEAIRAEAKAEAYHELGGGTPHTEELKARASDEEDKRNLQLLIVIMQLGCAATYGSLAALNKKTQLDK